MQKNCNRGEFVADLRKAYVTAVVQESDALQRDCDNWHHLLSEKGSKMSSQTLKKDFVNSYEFECACLNGLTEDQWAASMTQRRSELGIRVNNFNRDVENFIKKIPAPGEILVLASAIAISKAISEEDNDTDSVTSDVYDDRDKDNNVDTLDENGDADRDKDDVRVKHSKKKPYSVRFIHC